MALASGARLPITVSVMAASTMNALDTTIANVALPHMQGSVSASQEQVGWVLTSYIVAAALTTPLTGWLAARLGRKRLLLVSISGFVIASMLCGVSNSLPEIVAFRFFQGMFGAPLTPLSQAVMLDVYPPEKHGRAMAVWGMGTVLGPVAGPILGGFLTDSLSWRWVFFINLPIGILAFAGCWLFISGKSTDDRKPFDFLGFAALVAFIGSAQLLLDRGPSVDWFSSRETWIYLIIAAIGLWVFVLHSLTVRHPFFDRRLMADRNFMVVTLFGFGIGMLLYTAVALLPPITQGLMGYSAFDSGFLTVPRGVGALIAMFLTGALVGRMDTRLILALGLTLTAVAAWRMSHFDLVMGTQQIVVAGLLQGLGIGVMFVPMNAVAYATIPFSLRAEASSVNTIVRNMGSSVGISVMQASAVANGQVMHESLAGRINPADPVVAAGLAAPYDTVSVAGLSALNAEISRQATMVAYLDDFRLMLIMVICASPLLLLMRPPKIRTGEMDHAAVE
ncbi:DHA2 family efflux MFS transporter permease subunit [Phenylobacterium sp.]|uniref:DHA2 family efflux MFS transporter permease subunit n=1 Tax=Phenylobacterium sp. TaxID=1871053 RepID=UPI002F42D527